MSDEYNLRIYNANGTVAVPSLHNSYYISSEFWVSPSQGPYYAHPNDVIQVGLAYVNIPTSPKTSQMPLLLAKNDPSHSGIGLWGSYYNSYQMTQAILVMNWGQSALLALAYPETTGIIDPNDNYGMQVFGSNGTEIIYDSRRPQQLVNKGGISLPAGFIGSGGGTGPLGNFDYFTSPMHHHGIWNMYYYTRQNPYGDMYYTAWGPNMLRGNGSNGIVAYRAWTNATFFSNNPGTSGTASSGVMLFSKL